MKTPYIATVAFIASGLALAGCGASGGNGGSGTAQNEPAAAAPGDAGAGKPPEADQQAQPGAAGPAQYQPADRSIIYTGDLTVRVEKVDDAAVRAKTLVEGVAGYVAADKRADADRRTEAHLTLRVPAEKFMSTVDALVALGRPESRSLSTEDVTQQVVDLDAQITSQKASVDRTRALLARAQTVAEIVSIEGELAKRESTLGTLEARKRRLADLTSLSTVTVHLLGPDAPGPATKDRGPSFLAGLESGWHGFLGAMTVLLAILGFLLPFAVVLAIPAGAVWWVVRRRRPRPSAASQATRSPGP
jgi:hypothetical protein